MFRTITIFGSSRPNEGENEYATAYQLGRQLAQNGFAICCGGYGGIMEAASKGAVSAEGKAIGVTLEYVERQPNKYLTDIIECGSLFERVTKLMNYGDAFVVLQGGTGTLLELAAIWEFTNKKMLDRKPIACHSLMWKEVASIIDKQLEKERRVTGLVKYFENVDGIVNYIKDELK